MERNPNLCNQFCDLTLMLLWLLTCGMFVWRGLATLARFCVTSLSTCVGSRLMGCIKMRPLTHMQYKDGESISWDSNLGNDFNLLGIGGRFSNPSIPHITIRPGQICIVYNMNESNCNLWAHLSCYTRCLSSCVCCVCLTNCGCSWVHVSRYCEEIGVLLQSCDCILEICCVDKSNMWIFNYAIFSCMSSQFFATLRACNSAYAS